MRAAERTFDSLIQAVDSLVDKRVGIIRYVREARPQAGTPAFFHYYAKACNTSTFSKQRNFAETGGASAQRSVAAAKAIGEAVERYCAAIYVKEELPFESFDSAPFRCVPPDEFTLYTTAQYEQPDFPYKPFSRARPIRWTSAVDALSGEFWHVPASMVYMPYSYDIDKGEVPIAQPISTGLACHRTFTEAAVSALCEVIERDAFSITWQALMPAPSLRIESLSEQNRDLVKRFERSGSTVRILNITMDHGIPAILSILIHPFDESPAFVFAASAHLCPEVAIRKGLEELAHTRRLAVQLKNEPLPLTRKQDLHVKLYTDHANCYALEFLTTSNQWMDFKELQDLSSATSAKDLSIVSERITSVGSKPLLVDLTTSDIRELGLRVVRAVIPGFHPLFMGHDLRALGGLRLWNVPQRIGYAGITKTSGDNPWPHPFP